MREKKILLKYINAEILKIESRNPNYENSKKWIKLKRAEQKLYRELSEGEPEM
jgi:hypothetical protein